MKLATWLTLVLVFWSPSSGARPAARKFDFGLHALGELIALDSTPIIRKRDCQTRSPYSCEVQLTDGTWYSFENRRIVTKRIRLPAASLPQGIVANDNASDCRRRLESLTGVKFKVWTDDLGVVFVETTDLIFSRRGPPYDISVMFKRGRMQDVVITAVPHTDS